MKILSNKEYDSLIIEIEFLKGVRENDDWCIKMLTDKINQLEEENEKMKEVNANFKKQVSEDMKEITKDQVENINLFDKLGEENKKLREFKERIEGNRFFFKALMELSKPKTVIEADDLQRAKKIYEELFMEELKCLEEENKKLELQIAELMGEIDGKQMKIEELEKEIERLVLFNYLKNNDKGTISNKAKGING